MLLNILTGFLVLIDTVVLVNLARVVARSEAEIRAARLDRAHIRRALR